MQFIALIYCVVCQTIVSAQGFLLSIYNVFFFSGMDLEFLEFAFEFIILFFFHESYYIFPSSNHGVNLSSFFLLNHQGKNFANGW